MILNFGSETNSGPWYKSLPSSATTSCRIGGEGREGGRERGEKGERGEGRERGREREGKGERGEKRRGRGSKEEGGREKRAREKGGGEKGKNKKTRKGREFNS